MLIVIVALRRDRPADRLRARLRALARAARPGDPFPKTGYHSLHRVLEPDRRRASRSSRRSPTFARRRSARRRRRAGCAGSPARAFVGTLAQAPLGAITVYYKLNPWLVGTHFLLSIVVLALGVLVALEAWNVRGEPVPPGVRELALVVGAACGALLVSAASLATAAGPHSGSVDVPRVWQFEPAV